MAPNQIILCMLELEMVRGQDDFPLGSKMVPEFFA